MSFCESFGRTSTARTVFRIYHRFIRDPGLSDSFLRRPPFIIANLVSRCRRRPRLMTMVAQTAADPSPSSMTSTKAGTQNAAFPHLASGARPSLSDVATLVRLGTAKNVMIMVRALSPPTHTLCLRACRTDSKARGLQPKTLLTLCVCVVPYRPEQGSVRAREFQISARPGRVCTTTSRNTIYPSEQTLSLSPSVESERGARCR